MLNWFFSPTYIILPSATARWLKTAYGWLNPILPNLIVKRKGISTKNKLLAQKPYKLSEIEPKTNREIAALTVYYGAEKPQFAIALMSEFIQINCVVSNPQQGYATYQIYPFHYYLMLPEPIPPPDIVTGTKATVSELSLFFPHIAEQQRRLEPSSTFLGLCLTLYYLIKRQEEWDFLAESIFSTLRNNIIEFIQTVQPSNFLWFVALAMLVKFNWLSAVPPAYLAELQYANFLFNQALHTLEIGAELNAI